ncbi:MAG: carboxylating nicotinate-nucleotide diphosphorylase [Kordiimonadaceae bacterium]|nr:carboxylating nicotinate-nucleotide diphosphorylase [Kordiimonadaceae bacterium]MBO6569124.1 carboxylating nicotinate-nucleotide diphosphorylase [Kordiimonadaceae bacterium]MBO6964599.1 carboxylating nicotinate-nucleotide diphosphorylase [Kordiimonadaceae bacterium]
MSSFPLNDREIQEFIDAAFAEDVSTGDVTAESVIPENARLTASMNARQELILAGLPLMLPIFARLDPNIDVQLHAVDGDKLSAGSKVATISGSARALLTAERTALNILQHLSGIATLTRTYVDAVAGTKAKLLDTRKTIPGLRKLAKYAAACGGATNHRMGLFDAVMIKDNHIAVAGSVATAVSAARNAGQKQIQVECDTLDQVQEALEAGATSLLLDNMSNDQLKEAISIVGGKIPLEASGGVTLETIHSIAQTGVDFISVGRLTQSAPAIDIGLDYDNA